MKYKNDLTDQWKRFYEYKEFINEKRNSFRAPWLKTALKEIS